MATDDTGKYHGEMQHLRSLEGGGGKSQRMTVSKMAELLATRSHTSRPSVSLSRNAKGETQFTVDVPADTIEDAHEAAMHVYNDLCEKYPHSEWHEATPTGRKSDGKA